MSGPARALFDRYPAATRPTSPVEPLGNAGGLSGARLFRFESGRGRLVARQWPPDGPGRERLRQIHAYLKATRDLGFVPVPLPTLDGSTIVELEGRYWEIAPWMTGEADLSRPPAPGRLRAGFGGLAAFLSRLASERIEGLSPGLAQRAQELERLMFGEFEQLRYRLVRSPSDPATPLARLWLDRAIALAPKVAEATRKAAGRPLPLQPCLRDARPDHFLFDGDRLTGLVDFGAMGRDSVAGDLARLLGEGVGPDRGALKEATDAFMAILPLNQAELRAINPFLLANALLGAGHWARWHFIEGRTFDDPDAVVKGLRRGLERLEEAHRS
jgi:Ser/Thr protein kinase RdoA (MazF antagonist)